MDDSVLPTWRESLLSVSHFLQLNNSWLSLPAMTLGSEWEKISAESSAYSASWQLTLKCKKRQRAQNWALRDPTSDSLKIRPSLPYLYALCATWVGPSHRSHRSFSIVLGRNLLVLINIDLHVLFPSLQEKNSILHNHGFSNSNPDPNPDPHSCYWRCSFLQLWVVQGEIT